MPPRDADTIFIGLSFSFDVVPNCAAVGGVMLFKSIGEESRVERRKSNRVSGHDVFFLVKVDALTLVCKVQNWSGTGISFTLPVAFDGVPTSQTLSGKIRVDGKTVADVQCDVKRRHGATTGGELRFASEEARIALTKALSPRALASTIYEISRSYLDERIERAFAGEDFQCVLFKEVDGGGRRARFALNRMVVEVDSRGVPRFVARPAPSAFDGDVFEGTLEALRQERWAAKEKAELAAFMETIRELFHAWRECPQSLLELVRLHR